MSPEHSSNQYFSFNEKENAFENLQNFISAVVKKFGQELEVEIDRNADILHQTIRKYKNPAFDVTKPLSVSFTDEPGLDGGGLTRESNPMLSICDLRKSSISVDKTTAQLPGGIQ